MPRMQKKSTRAKKPCACGHDHAPAPPAGADRARLALKHLEWNPLVDARLEYEETVADLLGPCSEVLLDFEGRQISPEWLDLPEKVVLAQPGLRPQVIVMGIHGHASRPVQPAPAAAAPCRDAG